MTGLESLCSSPGAELPLAAKSLQEGTATRHLRNKESKQGMTHNSLASSLERTVQLYSFLVKASLLKSASFWHGGFQFLLCRRPSVRFQKSLKTATLMTAKINQTKF